MKTVIQKCERVDFNDNSFKQIEKWVYWCATCNCYHVKVLCEDQYQDHIYSLFSDESKLGEMNHLKEA